jgi:hypothetical protein
VTDPTPALELDALTKRYDDGLLELDDVYVQAVAGVAVRSHP